MHLFKPSGTVTEENIKTIAIAAITIVGEVYSISSLPFNDGTAIESIIPIQEIAMQPI